MNKCNEDEILSPITGKCIKIKDGMIVGNIKQIKSQPLESKILNPETGKLVNRDGKLGQKLLQNVTPMKPYGIDPKFNKIVEDCNIKIQEGKVLGQGATGSVRQICLADGCNYILKTQYADKLFKDEIEALYDLRNWKHAPKLYAAWTCNGLGYFIQEMLYDCSITPLPNYDTVSKILEELHKKGWAHIDTHSENIMCRKDGTIVLIDFGWAVKGNDNTIVTNHPLNKIFKVDNIPWKLILAQEDINVADSFGSRTMKENYKKIVENQNAEYEKIRQKERRNKRQDKTKYKTTSDMMISSEEPINRKLF
jgi:serine/threonine protein kinase